MLSEGRKIWGDLRMSDQEIAIALGVVYGDICRCLRDGKTEEELKKELGNIVFSTVRWIDDLGFDASECIELAMNAQDNFVKRGVNKNAQN